GFIDQEANKASAVYKQIPFNNLAGLHYQRFNIAIWMLLNLLDFSFNSFCAQVFTELSQKPRVEGGIWVVCVTDTAFFGYGKLIRRGRLHLQAVLTEVRIYAFAFTMQPEMLKIGEIAVLPR